MPQRYMPPLDDIRFVMNQVLGAGRLSRIEAYEDFNWETMLQVIDLAAQFATDVALPLNAIGDMQGCTHDSKTFTVKTPDGFKAAFQEFAKLGFIGLTGNKEYGGQGAPHILNTAVTELQASANFSLATYPGLTAGHAHALDLNAAEEIKRLFLRMLYSGTWTGTMCLTEPDAGTDLARVRTNANLLGDGTYAITGEKIFISCGEHDLTDDGQICHLVLARLPDAPPGIKGISLFVVPKLALDEQGKPGKGNGVHCRRIEKKMGIHGSATCNLVFDGAKGWLVGEPHKGMSAMFSMMNDARIKVALQGLGLAEIACQNATLYASERVQGSRISEARDPKAERVKIIQHANVRSDLMDMRCMIQGLRAMIQHTAMQQDLAKHHPDEQFRRKHEDFVALMTPILKSFGTDLSVEASRMGIQIHGGTGFITETGVEQFFRDAIIGTIYEGTNPVQAMDLVYRKVLDPRDFLSRVGLEFQGFLNEIFNAQAKGRHPDELPKLESALRTAAGVMGADLIARGLAQQHDEILAISKPVLDMMGYVSMGRMWLKMMDAAQDCLERDPDMDVKHRSYYETQLALGQHYIHRVMTPRVAGLSALINAPLESVLAMEPEHLVPPQSDRQIGVEERPYPERQRLRRGVTASTATLPPPHPTPAPSPG